MRQSVKQIQEQIQKLQKQLTTVQNSWTCSATEGVNVWDFKGIKFIYGVGITEMPKEMPSIIPNIPRKGYAAMMKLALIPMGYEFNVKTFTFNKTA
jgi:hypothetical protein